MKRTIFFALTICLAAVLSAGDHGTNLNPQNSVRYVDGAVINDYGTGLAWAVASFGMSILTGYNLDPSDLKKITAVAVDGRTGVINWGNFNIDPDKTMVVGTTVDDRVNHTLYNIVSGGNATTIAGAIRSGFAYDQRLAKFWQECKNVIPGDKMYFNDNVNVWIINPAGISISSGASVDLNGYLGLCSGMNQGIQGRGMPDGVDMFTTRGYNSGAIDVQGALSVNSLVLLGNDISVGNVNVPTFIGSGNGMEVEYRLQDGG